jgi:hypothetical protein
LPGANGLVGAQGPAGSNGVQGLTGLTGAQGLTGANGLVGAQGPAGSNGVQGLTGLTGAQGLTGAIGLTGPTGSTGAQGATGPSQVESSSVIFATRLNGGAQGSINSQPFGTFAPGKIYLVQVLLNSTRALNDFATLKIGVTATGGDPIISMSYFSAQTVGDRVPTSDTETDTFAEIIVNATSTLTASQLILTVTSLENSSQDELTTVGSFVSQLVGSLM